MADPIIKAGGLLSTHYLEVSYLGVAFNGPDADTVGVQRFPFRQIECVLMSSSNQLSFQVGKRTFVIPVQPGDAKHREAIAALVAGLERTLD